MTDNYIYISKFLIPFYVEFFTVSNIQIQFLNLFYGNNYEYHEQYSILFCYIFIYFLLINCLFFLPYFVIFKKYDLEKISAYECGFDPFQDSRNTFDVKYYLVAILFIIFDLEISFLFPWAVCAHVITNQNLFGYVLMVIFLILVTLGFVYEWQKNTLNP